VYPPEPAKPPLPPRPPLCTPLPEKRDEAEGDELGVSDDVTHGGHGRAGAGVQ
jgi:hypothetical protein